MFYEFLKKMFLVACINIINNFPAALVKVCHFRRIKEHPKLRVYYSQIIMTIKCQSVMLMQRELVQNKIIKMVYFIFLDFDQSNMPLFASVLRK